MRPAEKGTLEATGLFRLYLLIYALVFLITATKYLAQAAGGMGLDFQFKASVGCGGGASTVPGEPEVRPGYHSSKACSSWLGFAS